MSRLNTQKPREYDKSFRSRKDKDKDLHDHMSNRYGAKDSESSESAMWMHRLKSGWFENRARETLESKKKRMVEEYQNSEELIYRDGMNQETRKHKIRNHIEAVDDEIEYYSKAFNKRYDNNSQKASKAKNHFKENDRRKVKYGNFSNREDLVTIKKFDNELDLFRDQIFESLEYMNRSMNRFEDALGLEVSEIVGEDIIPVESSGDLSTFMSVSGFMISEDKYWDYRDMDNFVYEIDSTYLDDFYQSINLDDVRIESDFDYNIVRREKETLQQIRDNYLQDDALVDEIILINHLRNGTSIRVYELEFQERIIPEYNIVFLASGSGKSTLVKRYGDLFVDGDLLNPFGTNKYLGEMNARYKAAYPDSWDELNTWHRSRIYGYRDFLRGKILLIQHPDLVPKEILSKAKVLFVFRTDRTGIRMNQLNVESLIRFLSDMKKGRIAVDRMVNFSKVVVSRYDNIIFEVIRYFKLRLRFRIKYKYKYRPHVRKPPLDW